ncbi:thymidylate synthase [Candidatus Kaiserbacteria bacterium]|nr:thymidylate synthase [Candidatus Kaiserbacteria bacterium]
MYLPLVERTPDTQYQDRLQEILNTGLLVKDTPQDVGALTCFGQLAPMVFPVANGAPIITERKIPWISGIGEILAFINGARDLTTLETEFNVSWWDAWATPRKCAKIGVPTGDLGPGSYGPAFHDFPMPDGGGFNQLAHIVEQLKNPKYHTRRTLFVSPWIPFYNGWGGLQRAVVSPCHGWMHFRVINGGLYLHMIQRSADVPIGVPFNMVQYFALLLAVAQVTNLPAVQYSHSFSDAHIYENQTGVVQELVTRAPRTFPTLTLDPDVKDLFDFRPRHFTIEEYDPHPGMKIEVAV